MQARPLLEARGRGSTHTDTSADLGRTTTSGRFDTDGVKYASGEYVSWSALEHIAQDDSGCYEVRGHDLVRIQKMSEWSGRLASLYPTPGPPALLLSGTLMHRIKGLHPGQDTQRKLRPLGRLAGKRVLDTATGLGYTAIDAAGAGAGVITVEWDPAVIDMERRNPWSQQLFAGDTIDRRQGDIAEVIEEFDDSAFDGILHDPPVLELAGDLYGGAFYSQLRRVLARGGRLFHYIGNLESPSGARVSRGVARRLDEAGFQDVRQQPDAFGISARA